MVDVTPKEPTHRRALARCKVMMAPETTAKVASNAITKGDVLGAARIAGIQAAKKTPDLIPMCRPLLVGRHPRQLHDRRQLRGGRGAGRDGGPDGRRDGGPHRVHRGGPDDLRHVQVVGPFHERRASWRCGRRRAAASAPGGGRRSERRRSRLRRSGPGGHSVEPEPLLAPSGDQGDVLADQLRLRLLGISSGGDLGRRPTGSPWPSTLPT